MIFLTVGSELPFDRLVQAVDDVLGKSQLDEEVFAQIGRGRYKPSHIPWVSTMARSAYDRQFEECRAVISHAGSGTLIKCIELGKPLLVLPRRKRLGEIITDHQVAACRKFESRGDILAAYDIRELPQRIRELCTFRPPARQSNSSAIVNYIKNFMRTLEVNGGDSV